MYNVKLILCFQQNCKTSDYIQQTAWWSQYALCIAYCKLIDGISGKLIVFRKEILVENSINTINNMSLKIIK